jgi:hypothetical protein
MITRSFRIAALVCALPLVHSLCAQTKAEKEAAVLKYKDKLVVVKKAGLFMGVSCASPAPGLGITMDHSSGNIITDSEHSNVLNYYGCNEEPIHKGEVLKILEVRLEARSRNSPDVAKGTYLVFRVQIGTPHSVTRGVGAFAHQSIEVGTTFIYIRAGDGKDFSGGDALASQWFTLFDSQAAIDTARLGNTDSGVFVNQVKAGMSFKEVEEALGVPQTRVDLGEKVLYKYKYKDMTIEFHDGKVTDVR